MSRINDSTHPFSLVQFHNTATYPCSYFSGKHAISKVAAPPYLIDTQLYGELVRSGFRRSGIFTYRPNCEECRACVPVRLPVKRFKPNRSQRRSLKVHATLHARELPLAYFDEHYRLYKSYQSARHTGSNMDQDNRDQYSNFLLQSRIDSRLIEFTENGVLRMVSLIDVLSDGLSSVYTFFDPTIKGASLGTYNILWQIAQCTANHLPYLYLGYWIRDSHKMAYKANFRPIEGLLGGEWRELNVSDIDNVLDNSSQKRKE